MTVQSPPYALQNSAHTAALFRQASTSFVTTTGVGGVAELQVNPTSGMTVAVAAGRAWIPGTSVTGVAGQKFSLQGEPPMPFLHGRLTAPGARGHRTIQSPQQLSRRAQPMPSVTIHADAPATLPGTTAETVIWAKTPSALTINNLGADAVTIHPTSPGDADVTLPAGGTHTHQPVTTTWRAGHGRLYTITTPSTATITWNLTDVPADTGHAK